MPDKAPESDADPLDDIHQEALLDFDTIQAAQQDEREQCLQDRRFYSIAGAQWEGTLGDQFENKPKFEVNKVHLSVIRIINEYRNNRIDVDFISKDGVENDSLADTCDGLYRADEQTSIADEAYDNAFEEAVGGGFGAWRLRAEYEDDEDDENDHQRISFEPIYDADSCVFFDLGAKRQDKSDAKRCYVLTSMTHKDYEDEYDDDPASWPKQIHQTEFDWKTPDTVWVAELYRVEKRKETIHIYETIDGTEERYTDAEIESDDELLTALEAIGTKKVRDKKVKRRRIHKYIMSGAGIIEDSGYVAGTHIPVVPLYGKRWYVDNVERCMGQVRLCKDSQRLKNMQISNLGEISALSTVEKPILTPDQVAGHEIMWKDDNIKNFPYLLVNPTLDANGNELPAGPVAYTKPPTIPPAMAALLQITEQDMKEMLGNQEGGDVVQPNTSGIAVELVQNRLDMQTFIYVSNMAKAKQRSGVIWLSMAKDLFIEDKRHMKTIGKQQEISSVELNKPVMNEDQKVEYENDLSRANFDIAVTVGPSSDSKRSSTVRAITGMMQITQDPETLQVLSAMAMMNMEGEGIDEVRDYFRDRLIKMGVVQPTEQEAKDLAQALENKPEDPNATYLKSAAEAEEARGAEARSKTVLNVENAGKASAATEKLKAETVETLASIDRDDEQTALNIAKELHQAGTVQPPKLTE